MVWIPTGGMPASHTTEAVRSPWTRQPDSGLMLWSASSGVVWSGCGFLEAAFLSQVGQFEAASFTLLHVASLAQLEAASFGQIEAASLSQGSLIEST